MRRRWTLAAVLRVCVVVIAASPCQDLDDAYSRTKEGRLRPAASVSVFGRARPLTAYSDGSAPSRAAAALMVAAARAMRYGTARLAPPARGLCHLFELTQDDCDLIDESDAIYDHIIIGPSLAWDGATCEAMWWCRGNAVVSPRLQVVASGASPAALRLHAALSPRARLPPCRRANYWAFYMDQSLLSQCGFITNTNMSSSATLWYSSDMLGWDKALTELSERLLAFSLHVTFIPLETDTILRREVLRIVHDHSLRSSILFLDYDIWERAPGVQTVQPPPSLKETHADDIDTTLSWRVADVHVLNQLAPPLMEMFRKFAPTPTQLREVLEIMMARTDSDIEEAACAWAINNKAEFESWLVTESHQQYWIVIFLCDSDPFKDDYLKISKMVESYYESKLKFKVAVYYKDVDCASESDLNNQLIKTTISYRWPTLIGALAAGAGTKMAAEYAPVIETALMLYSAPAPGVRLGHAVHAATGLLLQLITAINYFISKHKWKRLAIISEKTFVGMEFINSIKRSTNYAIRNVYLELDQSLSSTKTLKNFKKADARIFYLNTGPNISKSILCEAHKLGMNSNNGYVWILREWHPCILECGNSSNWSESIQHFTVSYWWHNENETRSQDNSNQTIDTIQGRFNELWRNRPPPPLGVPLADALLSIISAFDVFRSNNTHRVYDLHGDGTVRLLLKGLEDRNLNGILQEIQYKNGHIACPLVYVDRWRGNSRELIARWQVDNDSIHVLYESEHIFDSSIPGDGSCRCLTKVFGDSFDPVCEDLVWFTSIACVILVTVLLCICRRLRLKRLARHDSILKAQLLAHHTSSKLVEHYVDRAGLKLHQDLGRGRFSLVRYGILRAPNRLPVSVAVKQLQHDAPLVEEDELQREAVTLASLQHENVVRLVGVCINGGPLLVLTAYAFFGNLQEYLYERRYLVEYATDSDFDEYDEVSHVSAESITRLAMEAASSLEYLSIRRIVHRDIRAYNFLVDENRTLKLANFGLARRTESGSGASGELEEYSCRRRGMFPVPWMAPESLQRGVFSPASDAWALGVLLLELVTLGARPYGRWPPERVLRYVCAGGRPPLPGDISPEARAVLLRCWLQAPDARMKAADAARILSAMPTVLRPALGALELPLDEEYPLPSDHEDGALLAPDYPQ